MHPRALRRELLLVVVGLLVGAGVATTAFLATDDGDGEAATTRPGAREGGNGAEVVTTTGPAPEDVTRTEFGELTDAASEVGVRVQWEAEVASGPGAGTVEFRSAHRGETLALHWEGGSVVDEGAEPVSLCGDQGCARTGRAAAREAMPAPLRPFYDLLRVTPEARRHPGYRVTGEGEFGGGILAQCGSYEPSAFDLALPEGVVEVRQCVDDRTGAPVAFDLFGSESSRGGATAAAVADATEDDFTAT